MVLLLFSVHFEWRKPSFKPYIRGVRGGRVVNTLAFKPKTSHLYSFNPDRKRELVFRIILEIIQLIVLSWNIFDEAKQIQPTQYIYIYKIVQLRKDTTEKVEHCSIIVKF